MNNLARKMLEAGKPIVLTTADADDFEVLRKKEVVYMEPSVAGAPRWGLNEYGLQLYSNTGVEKDPNGVDQHAAGAKLDAGKNRLGLVLGGFSKALWAVGEVGTAGANKYSDNGWVEVPNGQARYTDAMLRHQFKELSGEKIDPDLGVLHAAQVAWNALARLELMLRVEGADHE